MNTYSKHFLDMARFVHRRGMQLRRDGFHNLAFVKFAERDVFMQRARG